MYHSGPLLSLQYVDKLPIQLDIALVAKLLLQTKTNIGKKNQTIQTPM